MFRYAIIVLVLLTVPAHAQTVCGERSTVTTNLADKYGEKLRGLGISDEGAVVEYYESDAGKTWTILVSTPKGMSCIIATGKYWQNIPIQVGTKL